jgi:hypothetical protein
LNSVTNVAISELFIVSGIVLLTIGRLWYLKTHPVQRDVREAQLPMSKRLHFADFFRRPRSDDIKQSFVVLPYGTLWFAINVPLMHIAGFQGRRWTYTLALIDMPFIWLSFSLGLLSGLLYMVLSTFMLVKGPWNVSILWLTILGVFSWIFLILAPAAKLPIGTPMRLGKRVQGLLFHQHNYVYYTLLGVFWLFVLWRTLLPWLFAGTWLGQLASFA